MQELEDFAQKAVDELEEAVKATVHFCIGSFSLIVEESDKAMQEFSAFAEERIREGEAQWNAWSAQQADRGNDWNRQEQPSKVLRDRMFALVKGDWELAERLLAQARSSHPGHGEVWYWEKVIYDLERDN